MTLSRREFFFLLSLFSTAASNCGVCSAAGPSISNAIQGISRRGLSTLARSIPALSVYNVREGSNAHKTMEVAVKRKKKQKRNLNLPHLKLPEVKLPEVDVFSHAKKVGVYYGISSDTISKAKGPKRLSLSDSMYETLEELKLLRLEMERMRKEMHTLKRKMVADGDLEEDSEESRAKSIQAKSKSRREYEKLAVEIEKWAKVQLKETEEDGWREVPCNKMMKKSLNPMDKTKAYIKVRKKYSEY